MNHSASLSISGPRRRAAWCLVLIFLFGHTPLLPAIAGVVAGLDGGHLVQFGMQRGRITMTMHHEDAPSRAGHVHSGPVCLLAIFARDTGAGHSDHVLRFPVDASGDMPRTPVALNDPVLECCAVSIVAYEASEPADPHAPGHTVAPAPGWKARQDMLARLASDKMLI